MNDNEFPVFVNPDAEHLVFIQKIPDDDFENVEYIKHIERFLYTYTESKTYDGLFILFFKFLVENKITNTTKLRENIEGFHNYLRENF